MEQSPQNISTNQSLNAKKQSKNTIPLKLNLGFSIGEIPDMIAYQGFSFLIFTFYSVVIQLDISKITVVFIIWSIINAFNDPILGALSDKTRTTKLTGGRRRPWIVSMILPLPLVMVFLFTPIQTTPIVTAIYMAMIMILFDTFYTTYSLNHTSLYPEMFQTNSAREQVGFTRRTIMIVGLLIAFVLPGVIIDNLVGTDQTTKNQYILCGAVFGILIFIFMLIHIKYGIKEPKLEEMKLRQTFSLKESLKYTLTNKDFLLIVFCSTMNWYVFGLIPMILPIYASANFQLDQSSFDTSLLLIVAFLSSIPGVFFWSKMDSKFGSRKAFMFSHLLWILSFIPLLFIQSYPLCLVNMFFIGLGLGGAPYFIDRNISNIADQDELFTKQRREASFYGVHAIFIRLAGILQILSINIIFSYNGWEQVSLDNPTYEQKLGLRLLMSIFPAIALLIGLFFLWKFPLTKEKVKENQEQRKTLKIGN
ncbi:MFS transporter [Candidatus Harpocratesius sp.]